MLLARFFFALLLLAQPFWAQTAAPDKLYGNLSEIPVFLLAQDSGAVLTLHNSAQPDAPREIPVFLRPQDALEALEKLKRESPAQFRQAKITISNAAQIWQNQAQAKNNRETTVWRYVPVAAQVKAAQNLLTAAKSEKSSPDSVPVFVARNRKGYLLVTHHGQHAIPIFFDYQQLQATLARLKRADPLLAFTAEIETLQYEQIINTLATRSDPNLDRAFFVPLNEAVDYVEQQKAVLPVNKPKN
jgi:hypothetical protein